MDSVETNRLLLTPMNLENLQALHFIIGEDPDMSWNQESQPIQKTLQILQGQLKHYEQNAFGMWAVFSKDTGEMIGEAGLKVMKNSSKVELVIFIAKQCWGQGIAFEAGTASLKYGFSELELDCIVARTRSHNFRAQKLLKKLSFCFVREDIAYNYGIYYYELLWEKFNQDNAVYIVHRGVS